MMQYLLDTNVLSEIRKKRANTNLRSWFASVPGDALHVSVLAIGEIRQGVERLRRRDPGQARAYDEWLQTLLVTYARRIAPVTVAVAEQWGRLNVPDPVPVVDGLMAATAKVNGWTLVTRNTADVSGTGALLLNPFEGLP